MDGWVLYLWMQCQFSVGEFRIVKSERYQVGIGPGKASMVSSLDIDRTPSSHIILYNKAITYSIVEVFYNWKDKKDRTCEGLDLEKT